MAYGPPPSAGSAGSGASSGVSHATPHANFLGFPSGDAPTGSTYAPGITQGLGSQVSAANAPPGSLVVRYISGDEFSPGTRDPSDIRNLQIALVRAGLLGDHFTHGRWDDTSAKAFKKLLAFANTNGLTWQQALEVYQNQNARGNTQSPGGSGSTTSAGQLIQVTNPEDLRLAFQDASRQLTTGQFNDATINSMIAAYQHAEVAAQTTGQDTLAGNVGGGTHSIAGTVTGPPSVETFAREQAMHHDPAAYNPRQFADTWENLLSSIGHAPGGVGPEKL